MELALQIRRLRNERNLSQDDLAQTTYVSRQTVSNWERDRTYPDVHSLLLLSGLFDTTVDELIKGDVVKMEELLESKEPYKRMTRLVTGDIAFLLGGVALLALGLYRFGWGTVPSYIIFALMGGMGLALARQVDLIKSTTWPRIGRSSPSPRASRSIATSPRQASRACTLLS